MKFRKLGWSLMAYAAGTTVVLTASAAGAAVNGPHHHGGDLGTKAPVVRTAPPHTATLPSGYTVVTNSFTSYAGQQDVGVAMCPGTEQPVSGGAFVYSNDLSVNINSSYPSGDAWQVDISNASSLSTTVTAYAVCMTHSAKYRVVNTAMMTAPVETVTSVAANCPRGTAVMGGGAYSNSPSVNVYINSTVPNALPNGRGAWRVAMANTDLYSSAFSVYAVCAPKPAGYSIQIGGEVTNGPYSENQAVVTCPGASVPVGGGGFSDFQDHDAWIGMNTSYPSGNSWVVYENNYENLTRGLAASAVCAGT
jgi:hypothetical protein